MRALKIVFWAIILSLVAGAGVTYAPDIIARYDQLKTKYQEANKPVPNYKVDNNLFLKYKPAEVPDSNYVLELHPGQKVDLKSRLISNLSREQAANLTITTKGLLKAEYRRDSVGNTVLKPGETINIKMYADVPAYIKTGDYQASMDIVWHQPGGDIMPEMIKPLSFTMRVVPNDEDMNRFNNDRGKWGFTDRFSNVIIPPQFDQVGAFSEGLCAVMLNGRWGYIDSAGNYVIVPKYPEAQPFTSGVAGVRVAANQWGYVNRQDVFIMKPIYLSGTPYVYAGGAQAIVKNRSGKWVYIDKAGKELKPAPEPVK